MLGLEIRISPETYCASQGNWWFGSRRKTKDGVFTQTATDFWKALTETSDVDDVVSALSRATEWETMAPMSSASSDALRALEKSIEAELGPRLVRARQQFKRATGKLDARWDSLVLLYGHLLRLPIENPALQKRAPFFFLRNGYYKHHFLNYLQAKFRFSCKPRPSSMLFLISPPRAIGHNPQSRLCVCMRTWHKASYLVHQAHDGRSSRG